MTPAETLTAAADLIERLARDATPGPWRFELAGESECGEPGCCYEYWDNRIWGEDALIAESHTLTARTAEHIALWSPDVAILLVPVLRAAVPLSSRGRINPDLLAFAQALIEGASK